MRNIILIFIGVLVIYATGIFLLSKSLILGAVFLLWIIPCIRYRSPISFSIIILDFSFTNDFQLISSWSLLSTGILILFKLLFDLQEKIKKKKQ